MKILVVDDDELNCKILNSILGDAGYEVVIARDGQEALDKMNADDSLDVVLLDRMMPRMNGMVFMEHFNARKEWAYKRVIMQTAANQPKDVIEGKSAGVYYYLSKPFDDEIVLTVVRAAIDDVEKFRKSP